MMQEESLYWSPEFDDDLAFPGHNASATSPSVPILSGGLSTMASIYHTSTDILDAAPQSTTQQPEFQQLGVPSVDSICRSSPSPGMQMAPDNTYPSSTTPTPTSPMFAATPSHYTTLNTGTHFPFPETCTPQTATITKAELSPAPDSPLHMENTSVDFKELEVFVQSELQKGDGVQIKKEITDDLYLDHAEQKPKRKGGRPRDPVIFENGVPTITVIKKERRKEQNRRAARKCREKKKAHTEAMMADYQRMQSENIELNETVTQLKRKLRILQTTIKNHASQCSLMTSQLTPRS